VPLVDADGSRSAAHHRHGLAAAFGLMVLNGVRPAETRLAIAHQLFATCWPHPPAGLRALGLAHVRRSRRMASLSALRLGGELRRVQLEPEPSLNW